MGLSKISFAWHIHTKCLVAVWFDLKDIAAVLLGSLTLLTLLFHR
jgi:hypothetical protein